MAWTLILNLNQDNPSVAFRSRLKGSASKSFLTVHIIGINVNPDLKRFRYSGVDTAFVALYNRFVLDSSTSPVFTRKQHDIYVSISTEYDA